MIILYKLFLIMMIQNTFTKLIQVWYKSDWQLKRSMAQYFLLNEH